jgi:hypothetical protein
VHRVARAAASLPAQTSSPALAENEIARLQKQLQEQETAMTALDKWAHDLENTVNAQQKQIQSYEQLFPVRMARWLKNFGR